MEGEAKTYEGFLAPPQHAQRQRVLGPGSARNDNVCLQPTSAERKRLGTPGSSSALEDGGYTGVSQPHPSEGVGHSKRQLQIPRHSLASCERISS